MKNAKQVSTTPAPDRGRPGTKALMRRKTAGKVQKAIADFQERKAKISISAIAKAAGVTPALIHNTYPDLAERIRGLMGRSTRIQRDAKHEGLVREKETSRSLREELAQLRADFAKLASNNQTLIMEMSVLRGIASGKVVPILQAKIGTETRLN